MVFLSLGAASAASAASFKGLLLWFYRFSFSAAAKSIRTGCVRREFLLFIPPTTGAAAMSGRDHFEGR
jgi:hypothetical protein